MVRAPFLGADVVNLIRHYSDSPLVSIQNHRQVVEFGFQADVGDVGHPELVDAGQHQAARRIRIHRTSVIGIRGDHKLPASQAEQIMLAHDPAHSLL